MMTPDRFIATWKNNPLTERAGAQASVARIPRPAIA